jgi:hypothetical protein
MTVMYLVLACCVLIVPRVLTAWRMLVAWPRGRPMHAVQHHAVVVDWATMGVWVAVQMCMLVMHPGSPGEVFSRPSVQLWCCSSSSHSRVQSADSLCRTVKQ